MNIQRTVEPNWRNILYASFAEEEDNSLKINAGVVVGAYMDLGAVMKRVDEMDLGVFAGVEVYLNNVIVFSKYRKQI